MICFSGIKERFFLKSKSPKALDKAKLPASHHRRPDNMKSAWQTPTVDTTKFNVASGRLDTTFLACMKED
jgi:hypothetical protein